MHKSARVLFLALLTGCASVPQDPSAVRDLVESSQRALIERGDLDTYLAAFAPQARSVLGRGPEAAETDVVYSYAQMRRSRQLRLDTPTPGIRVSFRDSRVSIEGDRATLRHVGQVEVAGGVAEVVGERYELRHGPEGWKIHLNRYWILRLGEQRFDSAHWQALDAAVTRSRRQQDARAETGALSDSLRFPEMWAASQRWTAAAPDAAEAWLSRGIAAAFIGESEDALRAFQRAIQLDPAAPIPDYARRRLR